MQSFQLSNRMVATPNPKFIRNWALVAIYFRKNYTSIEVFKKNIQKTQNMETNKLKSLI